MTPRRRPARLFLAILTFAAAVATSPAAAFERWTATKRLEVTGAEGISFDQPSDLLLAENRLAVLDGLNNRLCLFDLSGRPLGVIRGAAGFSFTSALGLARDYRGRYLVSDAAQGRILAAGADGKVEVAATLPREEKGRPADPTGLLFAGDRLYLADNDNHAVRVLNPEGRVESFWGGVGDAAGRFKYPYRLATDAGGRIAVSDVLNGRVQLFTPRGEYLGSAGTPGVVSGTLFRPGGIAFDDNGDLWVADAYFGTVQVFDVKGGHRALLYGPGGGPLVLSAPVAIKVSGETLWVVEGRGNRVSAFNIRR